MIKTAFKRSQNFSEAQAGLIIKNSLTLGIKYYRYSLIISNKMSKHFLRKLIIENFDRVLGFLQKSNKSVKYLSKYLVEKIKKNIQILKKDNNSEFEQKRKVFSSDEEENFSSKKRKISAYFDFSKSDSKHLKTSSEKNVRESFKFYSKANKKKSETTIGLKKKYSGVDSGIMSYSNRKNSTEENTKDDYVNFEKYENYKSNLINCNLLKLLKLLNNY